MTIQEHPFYIPKMALIGVGLIGGSLVQALKKVDAVGEVIGVGRSVENLELAVSLGVIDRYTHQSAEAVIDADLVVIATPVGAFETVLGEIMPNLSTDAVVTDVGSVKAEIIAAARRVMGDRLDQFVPAHPIAGAENTGVAAAFPDLYVDHNVLFTPLSESRPGFTRLVEAMWQLTGAHVVEMNVELHDQVLGVTSHLPHVIVFALIDYLSKQENQSLHYKFAAGGLYDFTRIASSDARMWSDICQNNKDKLIPIIRSFAQELQHISDRIENDQDAELMQIFEQAKQARSQVADFRNKD